MLQWSSKIINKINQAAGRRKILSLAVFVFLGTAFFALSANATPLNSGSLGLDNRIGSELGLVNTDIRIIVARILRAAFAFIGIVLVVLISYGGFLWMTSQGDDRKIGDAKKIIINGTIGVAIMLSAYAITSFIISKMINGMNGIFGDGGNTINTPNIIDQNYFGTGALGTIIRDHYPARNQTEVPRNSRIIITFRRAVLPNSFITDTNGNNTFGDCINMGSGSFNWATDCDQLRSGADFINITSGVATVPFNGAAALASYESGGVFTISIRPIDPIGSDNERVPYTVKIGKGVTFDDPTNNNPSIFAGKAVGSDYYEWSFVASTNLDRTPPYVVNAFPANGVTETSNSVIQVNFSKAMDPYSLQGSFTAGTGHFVLTGNTIFIRAQNSTVPAGNFRLVNNYRTIEFTPNTLCGQNSCGNDVFCMPVCDASGATCTTENYEVLIRAAQTFSNSSFEAVPFSGAMDASGNALDGNKKGVVESVPRSANVFPDELTGDNYHWSYSLDRNLDLTPPYLVQVTPGIDATYVEPGNELSMLFSKRMRVESLYNIKLDEFPVPTNGNTTCYVPFARQDSPNSTLVVLSHCAFDSSKRTYYLPIADSTVEDIHFNCFYPGLGPNNVDPASQSQSSGICNPSNITTCCAITGANPLCCNGAQSVNDKQACLNSLKAGP